MYDRSELIDLFRERALKFGDFTLASGKKAKYYLDGKQITLHAKGLQLVSEGLLDLLDQENIDAVGGMSIGADPITAGVLGAAASQGARPARISGSQRSQRARHESVCRRSRRARHERRHRRRCRHHRREFIARH